MDELQCSHRVMLGQQPVDAGLLQLGGVRPHSLDTAYIELGLAHRVLVSWEGVKVDVAVEAHLLQPMDELERHRTVDGAKHETVLRPHLRMAVVELHSKKLACRSGLGLGLGLGPGLGLGLGLDLEG